LRLIEKRWGRRGHGPSSRCRGDRCANTSTSVAPFVRRLPNCMHGSSKRKRTLASLPAKRKRWSADVPHWLPRRRSIAADGGGRLGTLRRLEVDDPLTLVAKTPVPSPT